MVVAYIDNMESKIINIYFDQNAYPFKDKERSVIYPITGSAFVGFSGTQKIRFFVDRIGGVLDTTWVATTKLPNGQLIYELLQTTDYDDEIGEYYVELTLTQPYSALKGDISIGLSGYQGGVEVQEDEDTGIYTIVGTPTIQTSAVIKFNINYTPSTLPKQTLGFTDLQQVLAYMSNFMQQDESIVVIENTSVDVSGFEDGQVFYNKDDQLFYTLDNGSLIADKNGYVPYTGATKNVDLGNHTITALRFISGDGSETTYRERNLLYITHGSYSNTYIFRVKNANTNDYVATEDYVDNNIYEMASSSVVLSDSDYAYLLKNNVRIHYGELYYEKAKETASQVIFYSVDYQRTTTGGSTGYTTRTTKKITLTKSSQQLDAADINDLSYNKEQTDKNFAHSLSLQLNTTNYKLSVYLYDKEGNSLSSQTIDLPLESIVVSATYYDTYTYGGTTYQKVIVIVLATTDVPTIIPVGDLVDGLATTTQLTNGLALKVNKSDIADNLTTNDATKVLSAKQGYELNNAVVHNTGNETIAGNKTFTGSTSFKYDINFTSPDGTKNGAFRLADNGNFIWRVGNASKLMYDYANGNFSSWVDIVGNGDNAQSLGNASHYWKDLYLKGKWKDGTNEKSLQDLINDNNALQAEIVNLRAMFEEAVIEEKTVSYTYLQWSALPNNVDGQPIIYSGGSEMLNVKGNSCVVNQIFNYESTPTITQNGITYTNNSDGSYTLTGLASPNSYYDFFIVDANNHKYLIKGCASGGSNSTYMIRLADIGGNDAGFDYGSGVIVSNTNGLKAYMRVISGVDLSGTNAKTFIPQIFDLTLMGLDSLTTVDEVRSALLSRGINIDEYNPYNEGSIKNSKPTKLISRGFNVWDEEWENGYINDSGSFVSNSNSICSKNYNLCIGNKDYYFMVNPNTTCYLVWYDKNKNFISRTTANNSVRTAPSNAQYFKISCYNYGTTYNHNICINVSNATLNGTYRPYIAPTEYALDLPILRGVGTAQDDVSKVRVNTITMGSKTWTRSTSYTNPFFYVSLSDLKSNGLCLCVKYTVVSNMTSTNFGNSAPDKSICISSQTNQVFVRDDDITDATTFATTNNLVELYYELATPTDQPTITLPDDIAIENGDSFEIVYDNNDNCGADFDFAVATNKLA